MTAYIIESLSSTGWRRTGEIHWRLSDAKAEANRRTDTGKARACRVLPVEIDAKEVYAIERNDSLNGRSLNREAIAS